MQTFVTYVVKLVDSFLPRSAALTLPYYTDWIGPVDNAPALDSSLLVPFGVAETAARFSCSKSRTRSASTCSPTVLRCALNLASVCFLSSMATWNRRTEQMGQLLPSIQSRLSSHGLTLFYRTCRVPFIFVGLR